LSERKSELKFIFWSDIIFFSCYKSLLIHTTIDYYEKEEIRGTSDYCVGDGKRGISIVSLWDS